ncbi:MAG: AI-2E family transporter [Deltaproteobacteria bacterium]|nr:AI-2E family transporter [Deltaproteobacteria bacterium]
MGLFFAAFLPRLSGDFARLGREAPKLWARVNDEWTPQAARWLERRFPSLAPPYGQADDTSPPVVPPALPNPSGTVLTVLPLPGGTYAVAIPAEGIEVERVGEGRFVLKPPEEGHRKQLEDVLRERITKAALGLEGQLSELLRFGHALVSGVVTLIMKFVLVLMVAAFILIDMSRIHSLARGVIPARHRGDYDHIVVGIDRGLNGVIRGQLLICLVNGLLTYAGLLIFHVKYGLLLAVVAGVMSLIPIFGSILSSIPIVGIALVSGPEGIDLIRGIAVLGWILGIHFIEANFLNPNIIGTAAKMHPVLVIFSLIAGEHTYGLVGALLAVPVASIIQTLFVYFRSRAWKADASVPGVAAKAS